MIQLLRVPPTFFPVIAPDPSSTSIAAIDRSKVEVAVFPPAPVSTLKQGQLDQGAVHVSSQPERGSPLPSFSAW